MPKLLYTYTSRSTIDDDGKCGALQQVVRNFEHGELEICWAKYNVCVWRTDLIRKFRWLFFVLRAVILFHCDKAEFISQFFPVINFVTSLVNHVTRKKSALFIDHGGFQEPFFGNRGFWLPSLIFCLPPPPPGIRPVLWKKIKCDTAAYTLLRVIGGSLCTGVPVWQAKNRRPPRPIVRGRREKIKAGGNL